MIKKSNKLARHALRPVKHISNKIRRIRPEDAELMVIPRITNETLAEHREEILKGARKFIYPLQHSKHKVVLISTILGTASVIIFFIVTLLSLYRFQNTSDFIYKVTKVIPFPIARVEGNFVSYENYLFELKHYVHYYETQQKVDFSSVSGKQQLADAKKQSLDRAVNAAYIKILAKEKGVTVNDKEVDTEIQTLRDNSRLGSSTKVYLDVLRNFYDWSETDFKRSVSDQLLAQKLMPKLDTATVLKAQAALGDLKGGKDFGAVAAQYSEDVSTKDIKGEIGIVDRASRDVPAQTVEALFRLQPGQVSDIIDLGYGLEIIKNLEVQGDKIKAAHIVVNYKDINVFINERKDKFKAKVYLKI